MTSQSHRICVADSSSSRHLSQVGSSVNPSLAVVIVATVVVVIVVEAVVELVVVAVIVLCSSLSRDSVYPD
jgi:hypothetical protein